MWRTRYFGCLQGSVFSGYHVSLAFVPPYTLCPAGLPLPCTPQASLLRGFEEVSWLAETQGFCYHSAAKVVQRSPVQRHHFTCIHGDHFCLFGFAFSYIVSFVRIVPVHGYMCRRSKEKAVIRNAAPGPHPLVSWVRSNPLPAYAFFQERLCINQHHM